LTRVQHRHGADPQGQDTAAGAAARQELDQIGRLVAAVEGEADPAAAEAGARRQGYRHGEVHGDRGIGRVAAIGQDVAADQRRARLVGGDQTREAFDRPDLKRLVVAEPAGRQHERADRQDREPCPGHPLGHPLKYHHPMVTLKWKGLGTIPCA
jgi:hypothetical protein